MKNKNSGNGNGNNSPKRKKSKATNPDPGQVKHAAHVVKAFKDGIAGNRPLDTVITFEPRPGVKMPMGCDTLFDDEHRCFYLGQKDNPYQAVWVNSSDAMAWFLRADDVDRFGFVGSIAPLIEQILRSGGVHDCNRSAWQAKVNKIKVPLTVNIGAYDYSVLTMAAKVHKTTPIKAMELFMHNTDHLVNWQNEEFATD